MDKELLQLMSQLLHRNINLISMLQTDKNSTKRQILYRIDKLNQYLSDHNQPLLEVIGGKEVVVSEETRLFLRRYLIQANWFDNYILNRDERVIYLLLWLLVSSEYLSLNHFITTLGVSKSTILNDLQELELFIGPKDIKLVYDRNTGYHLTGTESQLRRLLITIINQSLTSDGSDCILDIFLKNQGLDFFDYYQLVILELSKSYEIDFVQDRLSEFIYLFILLRERITQFKIEGLPFEVKVNLETIKTFKEYHFTEKLIEVTKSTHILDEYSKVYLCSWILGISFGQTNYSTKDFQFISDLVKSIISRFELLSGFKFDDADKIFKHVYAHFRPAYYRLVFNVPITNPLTNKIKQEYEALFGLVKESVKPIFSLFDGPISDDEIAYLTLHFSSIYSEQTPHHKIQKKKAMIICLNGIGSSVMLHNQLVSLFPEFEFSDPLEYSQVDIHTLHADIIFTTKYFPALLDVSIPIVQVSPIMSTFEKQALQLEVSGKIGTSQKSLQAILEKYDLSPSTYNALLSDLQAFMLEPSTQTKPKELTFVDLLHTDLIFLQEELVDVEKAIVKLGDIMCQKGLLTSNYIEDILLTYREKPHYYVIADNIAMPHTLPEKGALRPAFGIMTFKEGIKFGDMTVKLMLLLCSPNHHVHLTAMNQLVEVLNNQELINQILKLNNPQEIIDLLKG